MAMTCIQNKCEHSKYTFETHRRIHCVIGLCSPRKGKRRMVLKIV